MSVSDFLVLGATAVMAAAVPASTANAPKKTVVLVHGAFADGSSWSKVIPLLEAKGLNVVAVQNPLSSLAADVDATRRVIDAQPGPVILVGHSWGGVVISQAGVNDKVKALVYVAAFAPPKGVSINDLGKGQPAPWAGSLQADSAGYLRLTPEGVARHFAQDLPAVEISLIAATQGPAFSGIFDERLEAAAYETKPSWYIVAKNDGMIPPAAEAAMAKAIGAEVTELSTGHVPMLSRPREVADVILAAADALK
ncbi:alpha/beta hydrolase [Mesorhizobium sp. B292B1B]|uniref:alpha/beta fold hydrolase n=1 Tax=unclassified Mesorhizobium TaxID=325217 RepID=UPI001128F86E|nr:MULTISPECIES: alpha/beta hydrolase [unclassified Mesorhizobium]MCA0016239.1 alpha/beta hydrolase [Mesorhizobium sp. B294B1A1]MCA0040014.1 alpha/beta hydrolase [Mesorhizobium sp. B292B1B]TPM43263.1 alpha/beta hydrolase [Mesorhizobium sp. B2-3-2]